jgi:hypothetical protein
VRCPDCDQPLESDDYDSELLRCPDGHEHDRDDVVNLILRELVE